MKRINQINKLLVPLINNINEFIKQLSSIEADTDLILNQVNTLDSSLSSLNVEFDSEELKKNIWEAVLESSLEPLKNDVESFTEEVNDYANNLSDDYEDKNNCESHVSGADDLDRYFDYTGWDSINDVKKSLENLISDLENLKYKK